MPKSDSLELLPAITNDSKSLETFAQNDSTKKAINPLSLGRYDYILVTSKKSPDDHLTFHMVTLLEPHWNTTGQTLYKMKDGRELHQGEAHPQRCKEFFDKIPEKIHCNPFVKTPGDFHVGSTDFTATILFSNFPPERIVFEDKIAELTLKNAFWSLVSKSDLQSAVSQFVVNGIIPKKPDEVPQDKWDMAADFQKVAIHVAVLNNSFGLFFEQGLGKTFCCVYTINILGMRKRVQEGKFFRSLILCPPNIRANWENEFNKFSFSPGQVGVMRGDINERHKTLVTCGDASGDSVWSATMLSIGSIKPSMPLLKMIPWDLIVIDESHGIKDPTANRTKACLELAEELETTQRIILTGTPIGNTWMDLWAQLEFLQKGSSGFVAFSKFKNYHGVFTETPGQEGQSSIKKLIGTEDVPLIKERLSKHAFMMNKENAGLQLPEKTYSIREVKLTTEQKDMYRVLQEDLSVELEGLENAGQTVSAEIILVKLLRLSQITSGHTKTDSDIDEVTGDESGKRVIRLGKKNPKALEIVSLIKNKSFSKGKKIVWCLFIEDQIILQEHFKEHGIKFIGYHPKLEKEFRAESAGDACDMFNDNAEIEVFLGSPQSGGVGLNVLGYNEDIPATDGYYVDEAIYMSHGWSYIDRAQSEDRCHRRGTRGSVNIIDIVAPDTVDIMKRDRVIEKKANAMDLQDVRDILQASL